MFLVIQTVEEHGKKVVRSLTSKVLPANNITSKQ